jgi:hypothetical protein
VGTELAGRAIEKNIQQLAVVFRTRPKVVEVSGLFTSIELVDISRESCYKQTSWDMPNVIYLK